MTADFTQQANTPPLSLAYGSKIILDTLGLWEKLEPLSCPIETVHVSEQGHLGQIRFTAEEQKVPALGYVTPAGVLHQVLYEQACHLSKIKWISIQSLIEIHTNHQGATVTFQTIEGQQQLHAAVLIAADGTNSTTRALLNIETTQQEWKEQAITATLLLSRSHSHIAYERFTSEGTLAILPLFNSHQCRLVWTLDQTKAESLVALPDVAFGELISQHFGDYLGPFQIIERGKPHSLRSLVAKQCIRPSFVLLGNAAHTLYPLAAQGFNLGLRDVAALAEILESAKTQKQFIGDLKILQQYEEWRVKDQKTTMHITDGLHLAFNLRIPFLGTFRGLGLLAVDLLPPLKNRLARQLMGLAGRLPKLTRGIAMGGESAA